MKNTLFLLGILISFNCFAQVTNDTPCTATSLGALPQPGSCTAGLQDGVALVLNNLSTQGAMAEIPHYFQSGCSGPLNVAGSLTNDIWFSFIATGNIINVILNDFPNANLMLWGGPNCSSLVGLGCTTLDVDGIGSLTASHLTLGMTYYIQISGNAFNSFDSDFSLSLDNDIDCNDCLVNGNLVVSPLPINGKYDVGQQVQFCFSVNGWLAQASNWFHSLQISLGDGWESTIISPIAASSNSSSGNWNFYNSWTSSATGNSFGPGFAYNFNTPIDSNPGNNYGDDCNSTSCNWNFCFTLTVAPCSQGSDLSVHLNTSADGEDGSWQSQACADDDEYYFNAISSCCGINNQPIIPICAVTVDSAVANYNIIIWEKPIGSTFIDSFFVYREVSTNIYSKIASVAYEDTSVFEDFNANPNQQSWKYKISVLDTCGIESDLTDYHESIHLQYLSNGNFSWNHYNIENQGNPVLNYVFLKDDLSNGNWLTIGSPTGNSFTDVNYASTPNASYRVIVDWNISCSPSRVGVNTSRSNIKNQGVATGIDFINSENSITIFPNPASELVTLNFINNLVVNNYSIKDLRGRLVKNGNINSTSISIDISKFEEGIYFINLSTSNGMLVKKLIIE